MPFRFRKIIKIAPGIKLNLSKSGISTSIGGPGHTVNFGKNGMRSTVGIPGTGLSYSAISGSGHPKKSNNPGSNLLTSTEPEFQQTAPGPGPSSGAASGSSGCCLGSIFQLILVPLNIFFQLILFLLNIFFDLIRGLFNPATRKSNFILTGVLGSMCLILFGLASLNEANQAVTPPAPIIPSAAVTDKLIIIPTGTTTATLPTQTEITPFVEFTPTLPITETASVLSSECPPSNASATGTVLQIIDGATLRVMIEGVTYTVKYIGVKAPVKGEYYYANAMQKNDDLTYAKKVTLISGDVDKDANGALLRYVLFNDYFLNAELLKLGCVSIDPASTETACLSSFQAAQQTAQLAGTGQWGAPPTQAVRIAPLPIPIVPDNTAGPSTSSPPSSGRCCKVCGSNSKPCGDACISLRYTCTKGAGCACK